MKEQAVLVLCTFGFLKEFRPSEPFLTPYLVGPFKNFTLEEVYQEIYPIGTYSTVFLLVFVFLVTDALRYKPLVIAQGLAGIVTYCLLIWSVSIPLMQICEVFYGLFIASDVAYATYIYTSSRRDEYRKLTSYTRIALLCGRFLSGVLGQFLVSFYVLNYKELIFITLTSVSLAAVSAFLLPSTERSVYFHREVVSDDNKLQTPHPEEATLNCNRDLTDSLEESLSNRCAEDNISSVQEAQHNTISKKTRNGSGLALIWCDFCSSYSDIYVFKWSLWWALTHCGYLQVSSYIQNLWQNTVDTYGGQLFSGVASAIYAITGILATWAVGQAGVRLETHTNWLLAVCALFAGALIMWCTFTHSLMLQYALYGKFKVLYQVMMTLANSEVAKSLSGDSHGLVFGFNTFVALLLQTLLTAVFVGKGGFEFSIQAQFLTYGLYFCTIAAGFVAMAALKPQVTNSNENTV